MYPYSVCPIVVSLLQLKYISMRLNPICPTYQIITDLLYQSRHFRSYPKSNFGD
nr:MAG TPA: hypothetical protein [Caudoviricetes sp.]